MLFDMLQHPHIKQLINNLTIGQKEALFKTMRKKIFMNDLTVQFDVDEDAFILLGNIERQISESLYNSIYDFLMGLDKEMQVELVDYIADAVGFGCEHYTNINYIDENLKSIYLRIDKELGRI